MAKVFLPIIVIAAATWGWMFKSHQPTQAMQAQGQVETTQQTQTDTSSSNQISASGSSDVQLDADMKSIDGQMDSMNSDSASVDGSFSDKPVDQTE